ncbi:MAG TPA: ABC transporter ATP-binding protein [Polyangiaceae bacterium]|nr:ABC transporter ATP-binding protein [Polyangiaceae bacterium]
MSASPEPGSDTRSDSPAVLTSGLVKVFGETLAVAGLDLRVERGECFGLLGPNGAGKTTTVEILEGLLEPTDGVVQLFGKTWERDAAWLRERVGVSLQTTHLQEKLTVRETIGLFRAFFLDGRTVDETMALVRLTEKADARYETLSGGQKQRVAVACALVGNPALLFLDEPTTGLDPQSRRALWDVVTAFKAGGGSVLLTTHAMDEAEKLCDRVAVVDHGKVIACGTPNELIESLGAKEVIEVRLEARPSSASPATEDRVAIDEGPSPAVDGRDPLRASLRAAEGVVSLREDAGVLTLTVTQLHAALPGILALFERYAEQVASLGTHRATLEDVFIDLTGRQLRE